MKHDPTPSKGGLAARLPELRAYFADIRKHPLLTREEERDLATRYAATRDPVLRDQLAKANLRLVVRIALDFRRVRGNLTELIQEGNLGLIRAIEKFEPERNLKLSTYASWWIRAFILKWLMANSRLVKIGTTQWQRRVFFGLKEAKRQAELAGLHGTDAELAKILGVKVKHLRSMKERMAVQDLSMEMRLPDGDNGAGMSLSETIGGDDEDRPDRRLERDDISAQVRRQLEAFRVKLEPKRDQKIFDRRIIAEKRCTFDDLGEEFGVSKERVRQLEMRIMERLKAHLERAGLADAA